MDNVSIGFFREDGDFEILATLNNSGGEIGRFGFQSLIDQTLFSLRNMHGAGDAIVALERQDVPEFVTVE